jgi:hypothetical protein
MRLVIRAGMGAAALAALIAAQAPAAAQAARPAAPAAGGVPSGPTDSAVINLVRLLVAEGVISRDKGAALVTQAEAEAQAVRAAAPAAGAAAGMAALPPAAAGTIRVPHVPESVRAQIAEEVKREVMATAKTEGWAAPGDAAPEWTRRIAISGDIRIRSQSELYSRTNSDQIFDFAAINALAPFDIVNSPVIPFLNTREDRWNRMSVRARLGIDANISDRLKVALQLATGDDNSPISTNESLGGGFAKRDFWLQLGYLQARPVDPLTATFGRMPNPFLHTQLLFDEDLAFDGVTLAVDSGTRFGDTTGLKLTGGAFPLDFGPEGYPLFDQQKRGYPEKWLFSGQLEGRARVADKVDVRLGVAYHSFSNVQGGLSEPCFTYLGAVECSTDARAPLFLVKGNTLSRLRQIAADPGLPPGQIQPQPQILGYTFDYDILDLNARARFAVAGPVGVTVTGNFLRNLSFDRADLCRNGTAGEPVNNGGSDGNGSICDPEDPTSFVGGRNAWLLSVGVGHERVRKWGEWAAEIGYRRLESDAVPDAFPDSDFHLGGTNARGFTLEARTGLLEGMTLGARWLSANEVSGEPFAIDVLQFDLGVEF